MSYKQKIINHLKDNLGIGDGFVRAYNLEKVQTKWGWIGSSGSRRARELAEEGLIERRVTDGYAEYRYLSEIKVPHKLTEDEILNDPSKLQAYVG